MAARSHDRDDDDDDVESRHASGSQDSDATLEVLLAGEAMAGLPSTLNLTVSKCTKFMP